MASQPPAGAQSAIVFDPDIARRLEGTVLADGWVLTKRARTLPFAPDETGGKFSVGYIAERDGTQAFVKVFDLGGALWRNAGNIMKAMMMLGQDHQYECQLLDICQAAKLDRIVSVLGRGQVDIQVEGGFATPIPYIVFEYAEKDVRKALSRANAIEDAWRLRILHQVAVGLQQLHTNSIAHQDVKPSNVLVFEESDVGAKLADLGRASRNDGSHAAHDILPIAGDPAYSPPEQAYGTIAEEWTDRREGCDLYHLGSLLAFLFTGVTPNSFYMRLPDQIRPPAWRGTWRGPYSEAIHVILAAFADYLHSIRPDFPSWAADALVEMLSQMCDPDFRRRGHPDARKLAGAPLGLDRYISKLDLLAQDARLRAKSA